MELRYYKMPEGSPILALLGQKWVQNYGNDIDYLHFHNYLEIGFCYEGQGFMILGEDKVQFHDREFTVIPSNYPHTTNSDIGTISRWEYLFIDVEGFLDKFINNSVKKEKIVQRINLRIDELAEYCHISETHLRRIFTTYMKMSPLEYINTIRIQAACDYLKKTDQPIADIAHKCGFTTNSTFNRNFKKFLNTSPYQWKINPENYETKLLNYNISARKGW